MNIHKKPQRLWPSGSRNGLTLIEVVVGSLLAGTLLVGILLSMTAHAKQLRQIQLGQDGLIQLDKLLSRWAEFDFREEKLEQVAADTHSSLSRQSQATEQSKSSPVWIRITRLPSAEYQTWGIEKVRLEAVSITSEQSVAKLEIVRHVP